MTKEQILLRTVKALTLYGWQVKETEDGWLWTSMTDEKILCKDRIEDLPVFPEGFEP
ncbi:MAG: hypothetical protein M0P12_03330 [Paludibacteraceae bacterium]|nr:hypothetical protein [Paludibacteraceae bacterium]MCK9616188.1 hypothetical protein [Candidatus Omnitrophota bacterium]